MTTSLYERLRPTLLSAIVHMVALILLGVFTLDSVTNPGFELQFSASDDLSSEDLEEVALVDFDSAAVEAPAAAVEFESVVVESELLSTAATIEAFEVAPPSESLTPDFGGGTGDGSDVGSGEGKGKGRTSVFGLAGEGSRFVYVFDRSKSMTSSFRVYGSGTLERELSPLALAKAELMRSLEALSQEDQFQIVFYNERPTVFDDLPELGRLFPATEEKKSEAQQYVVNMPGEGSTNHGRAMKVALDLKPDVIFLITDGEAKDDLTKSQARSLAKLCKKEGVTVHLIHFGFKSRPGSTLVRLATESGGQHRFIDIRDLAGFGQPGNL